MITEKKIKQVWGFLLLILFISLTVIVLEMLNQELFAIPKIVQDINSGVIGAILTCIITLILLNQQTENEELLQKKSVQYEEKLKIFNNFIETLGECCKDGMLTNEEIRMLIYKQAIVSINLNDANRVDFHRTFEKINVELFYLDENGIPDYEALAEIFQEICQIFRRELYPGRTSKDLSFDLSNFYEISYKPRFQPLMIKNEKDFFEQLSNVSEILCTSSKDGIRTRFVVHKNLFNNMKVAFDFLSEIFNENFMSETVIEYDIGLRKVKDKTFANLPGITFSIGGVKVLSIYVSNKNRVCVDLKSETKKSQIFPLEDVNSIESPPITNSTISNYISKRTVIEHVKKSISSMTSAEA